MIKKWSNLKKWYESEKKTAQEFQDMHDKAHGIRKKMNKTSDNLFKMLENL